MSRMETNPRIIAKSAAGIIWNTIPPMLRYGKRYRYYQKLLTESQCWSKKDHDEYQLKKIKELITYAEKHIPFYQKYFNNVGFTADQFECLSDITSIPMIDKDTILKSGELFISDEYSKSQLEVKTTGGTSGKQLSFYVEKGAYNVRELPFVDAIWSRVGYIRGKSRVARLRNNVLSEDRLWEYNPVTKELVFDSYHMTDTNIELILKKISDWGAEFLHTYPSAAVLLCEYIKRRRFNYRSGLKAILVTSENLYPGQCEMIEKYLQARCFTFYGHSECAAIAGWCECNNFYHVQSEYGYLELIDENGNTIEEPNVRGEIVCTGFDNFVMPFIRYRTGDYSSYAEVEKCKCGRTYRLLNDIEGRWTQEMFIGKFGNKISMTALNMHSEIFCNVENYQFVQNKPGLCILRIVKSPNYSLEDETKILFELSKKFSDSISVQLEYVGQIERTKRGKQRFVIQNIEGC